jgi:hypothetical protein
MTLYNLRTALDDFRITKFDADLNVESSYLLSNTFDQAGRPELVCECPAGVRPSCRHRQMLPDLLPLVDTEYFWDFERHLTCDSEGNPRVAVVPNSEPLTLGEPLITIPGHMPNQFVVVNSDSRGEGIAPAKPKATSHSDPRIVRIPKQWGPGRRI